MTETRPAQLDARTATSSFLWSAISFGGSKLVVFAITLLLARLLVPEDFGVVSAGLAITAFFEIALDLGVGAALIYEQDRGITRRVQTAFTINLVMAAALCAVMVASAPLVAAWFHIDDVALLRVLFLYLLVRGLVQVPDAVMRRDLAFKDRAVVEMSRAGMRAVVSVPLALAGGGPWALVAGILASEVVGVALTWRLTRFWPRFTLDVGIAKTLLTFGSAVLVLKVLGAITENADYLIIGNRLGPAVLGVYTLAYRVPELVLFNVFWIFSTIAFSVYARARTTEMSTLRDAMLRALQLLTLFAFPAGAGIATVSGLITGEVLGPQWSAAALPMALLALAMSVSAIGYANGDVFPAVGRPGTLIWLAAPLAVVKVVALLATAQYGLVGMSVAILAVNVVWSVTRMWLAGRLLDVSMRRQLAVMVPALVGTAGAVGGALPVVLLVPASWYALVLAILAGALVAAAAVRLLCPRTVEELVGLARSVRGRAPAGSPEVPVTEG